MWSEVGRWHVQCCVFGNCTTILPTKEGVTTTLWSIHCWIWLSVVTASHAMYGVGLWRHYNKHYVVFLPPSRYHLFTNETAGEQHMNHTPRSVKPHYRDSIIRAPPLPPVDSRATRAEVGKYNYNYAITLINFVKIIDSSQFYELLIVLWTKDLLR